MELSDFYKHVEILAIDLAARKFTAEGQRLLDGMSAGAMSGEILAELRFVLSEIQPALSSDMVISKRIQDLLEYTNSALGPIE